MHYRMLFGFYGGMALLACCVGYAFGVFDNSPSWLGTPGARDCGLGVVFALFAAFLMLLLSKRAAFMENLYVELSQALPPRDWRWNATAGVLSGFAEEFAFRGVALDLIGPVWSSMLFGLLHIGWKRSMWFWPLYAGGIGWVLAEVTLMTGTLWPASIFHAVYNGVLLQKMGSELSDRE